MSIVYLNNGPWGSGKGSRLTSPEIDNNFYELLLGIEELTGSAAAGTGAGISSITSDGSTLTFNLSDGTTQGPFPLPIAVLNPAGEWQNSAPYAYLDLVTVSSLGLYLVLVSHTTPALPAEFDPDATDDDDNPLYQIVAPLRDVAYDVPFSVPGDITADGSLIGKIILPRAIRMKAGLTDARAHLGTMINDSFLDALTFSIQKNGVEVGTCVFTNGSDVDGDGGQFGAFSFAANVDFVAGDRLAVRAPANSDPTTNVADLSITLTATRTDI